MLFTSVMAEEPLGEARALFLDNEFGQADVNKFTDARAPRPTMSAHSTEPHPTTARTALGTAR